MIQDNKPGFRKFIAKYSHVWVLLYAFIYMPWFSYLENRTDVNYTLMNSTLDSYIPFVEFFIILYFLWFLYIGATFVYFFFTDKSGFCRLSAFLITGMTIFLIVCTVYPNAQALRPTEFTRDNIFVDLVKYLYSIDTSTNVLPSIHVFNSIGAAIAIMHSDALKKHRGIQNGAYILTILIILSTVFLKQHSVIDVFAAFVMAGVMYPMIYSRQMKKAPELSRQHV